jgi:hypothetical protein
MMIMKPAAPIKIGALRVGVTIHCAWRSQISRTQIIDIPFYKTFRSRRRISSSI